VRGDESAAAVLEAEHQDGFPATAGGSLSTAEGSREHDTEATGGSQGGNGRSATASDVSGRSERKQEER